MGWRRLAGKISGRNHGEESELAPDRHRDHILGDTAIDLNASVEVVADDVPPLAIDVYLEPDIRVLGGEKRGISDGMMVPAATGCTATRRVPPSFARNPFTTSRAFSNLSSAGFKCARSSAPALVNATLRVARLSRRTPNWSSSDRIAWLRDGLEMPSCVAALVKLACSATATNAVNLANWGARMSSSEPAQALDLLAFKCCPWRVPEADGQPVVGIHQADRDREIDQFP